MIFGRPHSPTFAKISTPETRDSTYEEMKSYRKALQKTVASLSNSALGAVTWEISRDEGIHIHWQFIPFPAKLVSQGLVEAALQVEAENEKYPAFECKDIGNGSQNKTDYLRLWLWRPTLPTNTGESEDLLSGDGKSLVLELDHETRFDLQFPRKCMAKLLGLEKRFHWKDCAQSEAEEAAEAEVFKSAFKPFDFSLEEE